MVLMISSFQNIVQVPTAYRGERLGGVLLLEHWWTSLAFAIVEVFLDKRYLTVLVIFFTCEDVR